MLEDNLLNQTELNQTELNQTELNQTELNNINIPNINIQIYLKKNIKLWCYICAIIVGAIIWHYSNI
jgi:hypothetical protein